MPWLSWSIPADRCRVGSRLWDVPGSVCHGCYARSFGVSLVLEDEEYEAWEAMLIDWAVSDLLNETSEFYENKSEDFAVVVSSPHWTEKAIEELEAVA
jgi:hypothetical protein